MPQVFFRKSPIFCENKNPTLKRGAINKRESNFVVAFAESYKIKIVNNHRQECLLYNQVWCLRRVSRSGLCEYHSSTRNYKKSRLTFIDREKFQISNRKFRRAASMKSNSNLRRIEASRPSRCAPSRRRAKWRG